MDAKLSYQAWLNNELIDQVTKEELLAVKGQDAEIYDRFSGQLEFGTGGLRGIIGAGTNRMNIYTVRLATQAFAQYLTAHNQNQRGVVIAYDSRFMSREFAETAAAVLIGNHIPVYVFRRITPTPLLSFAVRHCQAGGGIMITASHNPKEYNGYKAYNENGIQLHPESTVEISEIMETLALKDVKIAENAQASPLWHWLDEDVYQVYFKKLSELAPKRSDFDLDLKIIYTPLHGAGADFVPRALKAGGFANVKLVSEQMVMDSEFSTVEFPNPEEPDAFSLAFAYAENYPADLIIATDPDCDRVGAAVWAEDRYVLLTGNQIGVLLTDFLLQCLPPEQRSNKVIIKTLVSTNMVYPVADKYGAEVRETLTGFKYIGAAIQQLPQEGREFLFGFEESCGYLAGSFVGDKDGIIGSLLIAQLAAYYRSQGITLQERLEQLYEEHGYYLDTLQSYYFHSRSEADKAKALIEELRQDQLLTIAGLNVKSFKDYLNGVHLDFEQSQEFELDFPKENMLQWETTAGDLITLRPSGTEPKMKLYISISGTDSKEAEHKLGLLMNAFDYLINQGLTVMS